MTYKESYTVELKRELNADFKKEIIAFANSDGGEIYIGVDDNGKVIGRGTHEELLETCPEYKEISDSQMGGAFVD